MMTIRFRSSFSALFFCLPLGLCVAHTAYAASDDDDEEWKETKGPRSENAKSEDQSDKKSEKRDDDNADKTADKTSDKSDSDDDAGSAKAKGRAKFKSKASSGPSNISLAVLGSYGFTESLSPGVGMRGGVHVDGVIPFYVGGVAEFFFGTTVEDRSKNFGTATSTKRFMYFGGEAGIDVEASTDLLLRPMFGLGLGFDTNKATSETSGDTGSTTLHPVLSPGIVGLYSLGSVFFVGLDFRYLIVPGASATSGPAVSATLGVKF